MYTETQILIVCGGFVGLDAAVALRGEAGDVGDLSVPHNPAGARREETGPRGFSNRTQIFADLADQHGF
ncbi:MAG: hypothetical protein DWQ34_20700 [Planctomycetota bacterium]|nr:MAG: hypothetical protein DWQ34_20700 [Planctomycetota bacterium]REK29005.1 MAG: hypothetical protein DWQ41_05525 [Planctomycetota bacterium]REK39563.1 MAG: hypothetical protein DWQ45_01420 [Planctomycetota bacterium]